MLGAKDLVDTSALASFTTQCQFKFGGIAKVPGDHPDPYHTYLSLAATSIHPPGPEATTSSSWKLKSLDPLINRTDFKIQQQDKIHRVLKLDLLN